MAVLQIPFLAFLTFFVCIAAANAGQHKKPLTYPTIYVDHSGNGNFSTIQAAIDSVPSNNNQWIRIFIKNGLYREQIQIPYYKPYIYIQGERKWKTIVVWNGYDSIATGATFTSQADNIVVRTIAFWNSYNYPLGKNLNPIKAAVAATISGDKSAFYGVAFLGFQDTLWDVQGRHYFKSCTIQGAVDFIFGAGQSIYDECTISVVAGALHGIPGFITAQGRSSPGETNGFVFKGCDVVGNGMTFLGRAWREYSRVIFYNCSMSDIIVPYGWSSWTYFGHEHQITFAEQYCRGAGSNTSKRVRWESKLSNQVLDTFTNISFVDNEGWINSQPFTM